MQCRVGFGFDVHRLVEGRELVIGGVKIDHCKGCLAHSDGDVLIHAICDAMLGAANLRDIGCQFPDNSPKYLNIDSKILLAKTLQLVQAKDFTIQNIDSVICLQRPAIKDHIESMKTTLAETLHIDIDDISIKATTTEKLGFVGNESGVAAYAVVLLQR